MRKRTVKILTGVAIAVVVLGLAYAVAVGVSSVKLHRVYAVLKADGRPMRVTEVILPEVPDAENAALLYESAILLLKAQPAPEGNLLGYLGDLADKFLKESLDADGRAELQRLLGQEAVDHAFFAIEQGTQRPSCRFDHDYDAGVNTLLPYLGDLRVLTRVLGAQACIEAEAGRSDRAWDTVRTQLKFAAALWHEPIIVSQVLRWAQIRIACRTIQRLCEIAPPSQAQHKRLDELFEGLDDVAPLVRAVDGERLLIGEWLFHLPKDELREALRTGFLSEATTAALPYWLKFLRVTFKPLFLADQATYMQFMGKYAQCLARPSTSNEADIVDERSFDVRERYVLTNSVIPAIARVKVLYLQMVAEVRVTRTGLALLQHRQAHNALPPALEALKLADTSDPFSEDSLLYRPEGQGFVLYSVGPDRKDNGGAARQLGQDTDYDLVWRFAGRPTP